MSKTPQRRPLAEIYEHFWPAHDGAGLAELEAGLRPRPPVTLFELADGVGVGPGNLVLDVGCGRGEHALALAERIDCRVVALDPLSGNLRQARRTPGPHQAGRLRPGAPNQVAFLQGLVQNLPFGDATFDLLWSRNMLVHVTNLRRGLGECARVLKPGGVMMVETSVQTPLMEPREATRLYRALSIVPKNLAAGRLEQTFQTAGFRIHSREHLGGEPMEFFETPDGRCSRELMRLTKLLRAPESFVAAMGETRYQVALAASQWIIYHLLGKLSTVVYSLEKAAGAKSDDSQTAAG